MGAAPSTTAAPVRLAPATCEAWQSASLGSISSLKKATVAVPAMGEDMVTVQVRAIGLNFADIFMCLGLYEAANEACTDGEPFCPGLEFAGDVLSCGPAVTSIVPGDKVFGFVRFGAFKSVIVTGSVYVRRCPPEWTYAEAAALLAQGLTAWYGLIPLGAVRKGSRVLVHSAAGGVGCAAMQICTSLGCEATGVVGSESKAAFLRERYPAASVLVRGGERGYAAQLRELPGGGRFDCVLDSLGGKYFSAGLESLDPLGRIVHFGATASYGGASDGLFKWLTLLPGWLGRPLVDPGKLVGTNRAVMGFNLIWLTERVDMLTQMLDEMLSDGGLFARPPAVGRTFSFDELPDALRYLNSGQNVGKVVVEIAEER